MSVAGARVVKKKTVSRTKTYTLVGVDADDDAYALSQAPAAGAVLVLTAGAALIDPPRRIDIKGSAAINGTLTIVGADRWGNAMTEVISGVTAVAVKSIGAYASITSITASATDTDTLVVGFSLGSITTPWVVCGRGFGRDQKPISRVSCLATVGAADGTLETTFDMFARLSESQIDVDESQAVTPGTPLNAQGEGCRVTLTTGTGTTLKVKFTKPGP